MRSFSLWPCLLTDPSRPASTFATAGREATPTPKEMRAVNAETAPTSCGAFVILLEAVSQEAGGPMPDSRRRRSEYAPRRAGLSPTGQTPARGAPTLHTSDTNHNS